MTTRCSESHRSRPPEGPLQTAPLRRTLAELADLDTLTRIKLDQKLFDKISAVVRLIERVDAELAADSPIRADGDYQSLLAHRRIDSFTVIGAQLDPDLTNAGDFSRASIEARIQAGYDDAKRHGVAWPSANGAAEPARAARRPPPRPATRKSTTSRACRQPPS